MKIKPYESVSDLLNGIGADPEFTNEVNKAIDERSISRGLVVLRHRAKLTQSQVAEAMGVKQSTISKIERSLDDDLRMGEIKDYLAAVGGRMNIAVLGNKSTLADQVKFHVFQIHGLLHKLAALTDNDETLATHVRTFFFEALLNFVNGIESASSRVNGQAEGGTVEFINIEDTPPMTEQNQTDQRESALC